MESNIEAAINWLSEVEDELSTGQYNKIYVIVQAAQRQAIEATLEVAKKQVSGWPAKIKTESEMEDDIDALINSLELKVR